VLSLAMTVDAAVSGSCEVAQNQTPVLGVAVPYAIANVVLTVIVGLHLSDEGRPAARRRRTNMSQVAENRLGFGTSHISNLTPRATEREILSVPSEDEVSLKASR
jgi:hypothetical protein